MIVSRAQRAKMREALGIVPLKTEKTGKFTTRVIEWSKPSVVPLTKAQKTESRKKRKCLSRQKLVVINPISCRKTRRPRWILKHGTDTEKLLLTKKTGPKYV